MRFFLRRLMIPVVLLAGLAAAKEKEKPVKGPAGWPAKAGIKTPGVQIPLASLKSEAEIKLEGQPVTLVAEGQNLLVPQADKGGVARIANRENKPGDPWAGLEQPCGGVVSAFSNVWIGDCKAKSLVRFEGRTGKVAGKAAIGLRGGNTAFAASSDSVWVLSDEKVTLSRIDPADNSVVSELRLGASCNSLIHEQSALWVTCPKENRLVKIDPKGNVVEKRIETVAEPVAVVFGADHLWVLGALDGKISKIDPKTNKVVATIETGVAKAEGSLAFGDGHIWVSQPGYPLTRINATSDKVVQQFVGEGGGLVRFASGSVWLLDAGKTTVSRFDPKRINLTLPE